MGEYQGNHNHDVVTSIRHKLEASSSAHDSSNSSIYRVPEWLRKVNEDAYRPMLVSIGPYHYKKDIKLLPMEPEKLRYLDCFLRRNMTCTLEIYVETVSRMENEIRECYEEKIELPSAEFIGMVLTDAAFIIELFLRIYWHQLGANDRMFRMGQAALRDIMLEENQLPLFILKNLYYQMLPLDHMALNYPPLFEVLATAVLSSGTTFISADDNSKHIVHLIQKSYINQIIEPYIRIPSASKLREAGVKFECIPDTEFLNIKFNEETGSLQIPKFEVYDGTESLCRNIMAFESCHLSSPDHISNYFCFLDDLIDTAKDVEVLVDKNIIVNHLGSHEELANLVNNMCKQIYIGDKYKDLYKKVNAFIQNCSCRRHKSRFKTSLTTKYFNHPWTGISVIYAIVILVLTLLQTISSFKDDKK